MAENLSAELSKNSGKKDRGSAGSNVLLQQSFIHMKDKDFIGKSVVSLADGAKVGTVRDLIFNGINLTSILLHGEHGEGLLPYASVGANGPDAITIESYTLVDWNAGHLVQPEGKSINELRKLPVMDAEGHNLGHLHSLTLDSQGQIEEISVRSEGVFGLGAHETIVPASQIRAVGAKLITVESDAKV